MWIRVVRYPHPIHLYMGIKISTTLYLLSVADFIRGYSWAQIFLSSLNLTEMTKLNRFDTKWDLIEQRKKKPNWIKKINIYSN